MSARLDALVARRERLVARAAEERVRLGTSVAALSPRGPWLDVALLARRALGAHPLWLAVGALAAIVFLRRGASTAAWAGRAWIAWRAWEVAQAWLKRPASG